MAHLFSRSKKFNDETRSESGKSPKSPLAPSGKSPDASRVIIKSSPREKRNSKVNSLLLDSNPDTWSNALAPLSPTTVYSSTSPGCRSPLEPKREKKEKKPTTLGFDASPILLSAGCESPKKEKESVGSSSPILARRMVTSPLSSPSPTRNKSTQEVSVEKKNAPIVQLQLSHVEINQRETNTNRRIEGGKILVHPSQSFKISASISKNYLISITFEGEEEEIVQNLQPRKLVLNIRPRTYVMVDDETFTTFELSKKVEDEKVQSFEEILSTSCHFEKIKWELEATNREAIAVEPYEAGDLRFEIGDSVKIIRQDGLGYFMGECDGNKGRFPAFLVKLIDRKNELPFKGDFKLYRVIQQYMTEIDPSTTEFTKNGSWMQGWVQIKNLSTGLWSDCYLQAKTCGLLWYQSSNSAPEGFVQYENVWSIQWPLKEEEETHPNAFGLVCKNQRLILGPETEEKTLKWVKSLEFVQKLLDNK